MEILSKTAPETKRRVAIYIRVSTDEQHSDGYGEAAQKNRLLDHINNNPGLKLMTKLEWIYSDVHTGSELNREGLSKLREDIKEGKFDVVAVWKIDRISRSLPHLLVLFEEFKNNNVSLMSLQENIDFSGPIGTLLFQMFGALAQFERELIKGRTRAGLIASAEMGNFTGTAIPYGYRPVASPKGKGKHLELIPKEKEWVVKMFEWYVYEEMGFGQIAVRLNKLKVSRGEATKTKDRGSRWTDKMVSTIIENPLYKGSYVANRKDESGKELPTDQWTTVPVPACISSLLFQQACEARAERTGGKKNTPYLLTGKLKDMTLVSPQTFVGAKRSKGGFSYRRKQFDRGGEHFQVFEIPAAPIEDFVWRKVMDALKHPDIFIERYLAEATVDKKEAAHIETTLSVLQKGLLELDIREARVQEAYENGYYAPVTLSSKLATIEKERSEIQSEIQELEDKLALMASVDTEVKKLKDASEKVKYRLDHLTTSQKKVLCKLFVDRVEMYRDKTKEGKWEVRANVHFRFNPDKLIPAAVGGRTETNLKKASKEAKSSKYGRSGGT